MMESWLTGGKAKATAPVAPVSEKKAEKSASKAAPPSSYSLENHPPDHIYVAHPVYPTMSWLAQTCNASGAVDPVQSKNKYHWQFCTVCKNMKKPRQINASNYGKHKISKDHEKRLDEIKLKTNVGHTVLDGQLNKFLVERATIIGAAAFLAKNQLSLETYGKHLELLALFNAPVPRNKNGDMELHSTGVGRALIMAIGKAWWSVLFPLLYLY
jgi:hypothetical protein